MIAGLMKKHTAACRKKVPEKCPKTTTKRIFGNLQKHGIRGSGIIKSSNHQIIIHDFIFGNLQNFETG